MTPHDTECYTIRSSAERADSRLKEDFGADTLWPRGTARSLCTRCLASLRRLRISFSACSLSCHL